MIELVLSEAADADLAEILSYGVEQFGEETGEAYVAGFEPSLALIADAAHNVSDGGSILLALVAAWAAGLPVHGARTFGWRRVEGVLRPGTDVALLACKRGHPVVVRRAGELARTG